MVGIAGELGRFGEAYSGKSMSVLGNVICGWYTDSIGYKYLMFGREYKSNYILLR